MSLLWRVKTISLPFPPAIGHSSDYAFWANTDISKDNVAWDILRRQLLVQNLTSVISTSSVSLVCCQYLWYLTWHTSHLGTPSSTKLKTTPKVNHTDVTRVKPEIQQYVFSCLRNTKQLFSVISQGCCSVRICRKESYKIARQQQLSAADSMIRQDLKTL